MNSKVNDRLALDEGALDEACFPVMHPASVMRLVAVIAQTWRMAKDTHDPGLVGRAEMNLRSAAMLYEQYFPEK